MVARTWLWITLALAAIAGLLAPPAGADITVLEDGTRLEGRLMRRGEDAAIEFQAAEGPPRRLAAVEVREVRETTDPAAYVRFSRYSDRWSRLEVLCRRFRSRDGKQTVTLSGAVHIADLAYYRALQRHLDAHDVVLFEGVGATNGREDLSAFGLPDAATRRSEIARPFRPTPIRVSDAAELDMLTALQLRMGESLDLSFQKDGIDYARSWWIAADVSLSELQRLFEHRERSLLSDAFSTESQRAQQAANEIVVRALGEAATSVFTGKAVKTIWKETFAMLLAQQMVGDAPAHRTATADEPKTVMQEVVIVGRNKVVIRKLGEVLRAPGVRSVAIFYGAGHNADLETRLLAEGFVPVSDEWLPAWDIRSDHRSLLDRWRGDPKKPEPPAPTPPAGRRREPTLF